MITSDDRFAIQDLVAQFAHCSDYRDWAGLEALYAPDIVTEMDGLPMKYTGIAEQLAHARESDEQTGGKNRHVNYNLMIREEANGDVVAVYAFLNVNAGASPMDAKIVVSGRMRDTVVRTEAGWKFSRRLVQFDQAFELNF